MSLPAVSTVLYKNKADRNGKYAIRLRLYFGKEHFISLGDYALPSEWNARNGRLNAKAENYESRNVYLAKKEREARAIITEMDEFSFDDFKNRFKGTATTTVTVQEFLAAYEAEWKKKGSIGSSQKYKQLRLTLEHYHPAPLSFKQIDYTFLKGFEAYILGRGNKKSTAHYYMRHLRATWNEARKRGMADTKDYPFKSPINPNAQYSFAHLKGDYNPKPMSPESLQLLRTYDRNKYPQFALSYDIYMFCFLCRGMNFVDAVKLTKKENIRNGRIIYLRTKTKKRYSVKLSQAHVEIIERYEGSEYVFPVMDKAPKDLEANYKFVRLALRKMNKDMNKLGELLGIEEKLDSYSGRYTYTDILVKAGTSAPLIQQALGQQSLVSTQHYIKKHAESEVDKTDELLYWLVEGSKILIAA